MRLGFTNWFPMGNTVTTPTCFSLPKSVRVVNTDGKVLMYSACQVVTVADILQSHPHHCLTQAGQERNLSRRVVLRDEEVLKPGTTYVVLPMPRLFNIVANKRPSLRPSISHCWFCVAPKGDSVSDSFADDNNNDYWHRSDVRLPASLAETKDSASRTSRSPSSPSVDLQRFLKNAGIEWKEITDLSKTWRPNLESIKEESMKLLPPRQSLAELIESETFLVLLRGRSEEREDRG